MIQRERGEDKEMEKVEDTEAGGDGDTGRDRHGEKMEETVTEKRRDRHRH